MADVNAAWLALGIEDVFGRFGQVSCRWWITGGHALELSLGRSWRDHHDMDVSLCRDDVHEVRRALPGWELWVAAHGVLRLWAGEPLVADAGENNIWCRTTPGAPWALDITVSDGNTTEWVYRRDTTLRVLWADAVLWTPGGVPYLAPELQLLFKSVQSRPRDDMDAEVVIPTLSADRRLLLAQRLPAHHPWLQLIG